MSAFNRLIAQFEDREIVEIGELLHLFSLRFMMAKYHLLSFSYDEILQQCQKYLDDLLDDNKLPAQKLYSHNSGFLDSGYDGFGYWVDEDYRDKFNDVLEYLEKLRDKAFQKRTPALANELLKFMQEDAEAFQNKLTETPQGINEYALLPVLAKIKPNEFIDAWLGLPQENWNIIARTLQYRYKRGELFNDLKNEKDWLKYVLEILNGKTESATGITKLRLLRFNFHLGEIEKIINHPD